MLHKPPGHDPLRDPLVPAIDLDARLREIAAERDKARADYRRLLIDCERRSQADYDKAVMTLSGGALAISFSFVNTFLGDQPALSLWSLGFAWTAWVLSLSFSLASHFMSAAAHRHALMQHDSQQLNSGVRAGGWQDAAVQWLNVLAGVAFVAGTLYIGWFGYWNLR